LNELSEYVARNAQKPVNGDVVDFLLKYKIVLVEPKMDGTRVFIFKSGGKVAMATRHNGLYTKADLPELLGFVKEKIPDGTILDGEFMKKEGRVYCFDLIYVNNVEVRYIPLIKRKEILKDLVDNNDLLQSMPFTITGSIDAIEAQYNKFIWSGFEGMVVKALDAPYGEVGSWIKRKKFDTYDVVITGVKETKQHQEVPWAWYIHVFDEKKNKVQAGSVSSCLKGVDRRQIKEGTVVEVRAQEIYTHPDGSFSFRHPVIMRIRDDKLPEECTTDQFSR